MVQALGPLLGLAALVGFALEVAYLPNLLWHDAFVDAWFAAQRGCSLGAGVALLTRAAPYLGIAFVLSGLGLGVARRARLANVVCALALLGAGLLLTEALKVLFERARPDVPTWKPLGDAFPSGHVANVLLCIGTAVRLVPRSPNSRLDTSRLALVLGGVGAVTAVAFSRLYLDRHWFTDVVGSLLLGVAFFGLTPWGHLTGRIASLASVVVITTGLLFTAASGARIDLSSPSVSEERPQFQLPLARAHARRQAGLDGAWVRARGPDGGYLHVMRPEVRFTIRVRDGKRAVLRFAARPIGLRTTSCHQIEVEVDGALVGRDQLTRRWGAYTFALPRLHPGLHEVRLRLADGDDLTGWALRALQVL